jgi:hypothetical protein
MHQLGSIFSGLFLSVKDTTPCVKPVLTVRQPAWQPVAVVGHGTASVAVPPAMPGHSAAGTSSDQAEWETHGSRARMQAPTRQWLDSPYLRVRMQAAERQLKVW